MTENNTERILERIKTYWGHKGDVPIWKVFTLIVMAEKGIDPRDGMESFSKDEIKIWDMIRTDMLVHTYNWILDHEDGIL